MEPAREQASPAGGQFSLWDAVSIIIGIVVGTGIYETPPLVFQNVPGPWTGLGVWALAGLLTLIGALCYAELASTYPRSGGDYVYLTRAFGPCVGFLFGWAQLAVLRTGNIGMMAYVFADYAARLWDFGPGTTLWYAAFAVGALSLLNILGVVFGKRTQNMLTAAKVLGLGGILVAGLLWSTPTPMHSAAAPAYFDSFMFAMVLAFFTYGGWNDAAYVAAELRDGQKTIARALIVGALAITAIYLLVNAAYLWGLGFEGVRQSTAVAADVVQRPLGPWGARAISLLVMISALGSANGMILTGSRVYSSLGADHRAFALLGRWHPRLGSPAISLTIQAAICIGMIAVAGTAAGRAAVDAVLAQVGLPSVSWGERGGFETLLRCTTPVFWLFFLLTAVGLFVLRAKDRQIVRPFTVPFYPVLPLIFCATCAYLLYGGIQYAGTLTLVGAVLVLAGLPLFFLSPRPA